MKELSLNLFLGIISGLMTVVLVCFIHNIWIGIIKPWFEKMVYKDVNIAGKWNAEGVFNSTKQKELWVLKQVAHAINATIVVVEGPDRGKSYSFVGQVRNLILTGCYERSDKDCFDRGTVSMMVVKNGDEMEGKGTYYNDPEHDIKTVNYKWVKEI